MPARVKESRIQVEEQERQEWCVKRRREGGILELPGP